MPIDATSLGTAVLLAAFRERNLEPGEHFADLIDAMARYLRDLDADAFAACAASHAAGNLNNRDFVRTAMVGYNAAIDAAEAAEAEAAAAEAAAPPIASDGMPEGHDLAYAVLQVWHNPFKLKKAKWVIKVQSARADLRTDAAMSVHYIDFVRGGGEFKKKLRRFAGMDKLSRQWVNAICDGDLSADLWYGLISPRTAKNHRANDGQYAVLAVDNNRPVELALFLGPDSTPLIFRQFHVPTGDTYAGRTRKTTAAHFLTYHDPDGHHQAIRRDLKNAIAERQRQGDLRHYNPVNDTAKLMQVFHDETSGQMALLFKENEALRASIADLWIALKDVWDARRESEARLEEALSGSGEDGEAIE